MTDIFPTLNGYKVIEKIYDGVKTQVYRARKNSDQQSVVIKFLNSDLPTFKELLDFRNQYTLTKDLDVAGVVRPLALERHKNKYALIMPDSNAIGLSDYLEGHELTITTFFHLAIRLTTILQGLHQNQIIHKDIKPQNILIHPETKQLELIDFSIASVLPKETKALSNVNVLEGTLAYLSPEQTGRMNRGIDYRTDFYSLGVTFYVMLTGQLPFVALDPMEMVHCHIAKTPAPPMLNNTAMGPMVNDIILKLMAKSAEERYQSASGLCADLETCQQHWENHGQIPPFQLGRRDVAEHFNIPEKLYGRMHEVACLLAAFDRVSDGDTELMLVGGFSGIGKTALINEVHKPIVRDHGYFIKGKFDQFNRDIPFSALAQALRTLLQYLLTESAEHIQQWKTQLLSALGDSGQVLIDLIPELEQLIGTQPPVAKVSGAAAANRFHRVLQKFIAVCTTEHPLVLFLDDLQWIDSASLKLLPLLMNPIHGHRLLLIGAYRDNEVNAGHPLLITLQDIRQTNLTVNQITLGPLSELELNNLIADTCQCTQEKAMPLTTIVRQKTQGNPFFSHQFLKYLYEEKMVIFDFDEGYWRYDLARVKQLAASNDVVEFMATQLQKLPAATQQVLQLSACIGNQFNLSIVSLISEKSRANTANDLWRALQEGLIVPLNQGYKLYLHEETVAIDQSVPVLYRFSHDRVQQAAYSLIPADQKAHTHLKIGRLLKQKYGGENDHAHLFDLVNQLNPGIALIVDQRERDELAQLNFKAGNKAIAATAYVAAKKYFSAGLKLLSPQAWNTQYTFTLRLYNAAIESAYLSGDYAQQKEWSTCVRKQAKSLLDTVKTHYLQCATYTAQSHFYAAIDYTLPILEQLGVDFLQDPSEQDLLIEVDKVQSALAGKPISLLMYLPNMTDEQSLSILQLLEGLMQAIYIAKPKLKPLVAAKAVQVLVNHGNAAAAPFLYAFYGMILGNAFGRIEEGHEFGLLSLRMIHPTEKSYIYGTIFSGIKPWIEPLNDTLNPLLEAYQSGLEIGDLVNSGLDAVWYSVNAFYAGNELSALEPRIAAFIESIVNMDLNMFPEGWLRIIHQTVLNLLARSDDPKALQGTAYRESERIPKHLNENDRYALCTLNINRMILCHLLEQNDRAFDMANQAAEYLDGVPSTISEAIFHFYDSLVRLAVYLERPPAEQQSILAKVAHNQKKMRHWADHAPMNFQHKWHLVEAERLRVANEYLTAMTQYDSAIAGAKENAYSQEEALANELAARFYLHWNKEIIAQAYMTQAYYAYARWGAKAKIEDLQQRYRVLLTPILLSTTSSTDKSITAITERENNLDLNTVMKSTRILSGELSLTKLVEKMLDILMENAGARRSVLLLSNDGHWIIAGECSIENETRQVLPDITLADYTQLPHELINHVIHKQVSVVLDDARDPHQRFFQAPYFHRTSTLKSVLCLPIRSQARLTGLLYLENSLVVGAFPENRLEMLKILAAQAAISLENALLYASLEEKVRARTAELHEQNKKIHESLVYASSMQLSMLPSHDCLKSAFRQHFVIWQPRDVVGGDIYFCHAFSDGCIIMVIDCTGHGVPGAFMTMIAGSALASIALENYLQNPAGILTVVNQFVTKTLQQGFHDAKSDNGMDMGICCLHHASGELVYSGAKFSLLIAHDDRIDDIKGNRKSLGYKGSNVDFAFTNYALPLSVHAAYYLCSDGFIDQCGGEKKFGFGKRRFNQMLLAHYRKPFAEQKDIYVQKLQKYQGDLPRYDDVTVLGFSFFPKK